MIHKTAIIDSKAKISNSAKIGGPHLNSNPRLRKAVHDAKSNSMPNQNIERAIQKGIEIVKNHNHPYTDTSDKLTEAQEMTQIEWIKGIRPSNTVYDRLFDVEKTIDQQESENYNDKESPNQW